MARPRYKIHLRTGEVIYCWERDSLIPTPRELYARYGLKRGEKRKAFALIHDLPMKPYIYNKKPVRGMEEKIIIHMQTPKLNEVLATITGKTLTAPSRIPKQVRIFRTVIDKGDTMFIIDGISSEEVMAYSEYVRNPPEGFTPYQLLITWEVVVVVVVLAIAAMLSIKFITDYLSYVSDNETQQKIAAESAKAIIEKYKHDEALLNFYGVKETRELEDGSLFILLGNGRSYIVRPDGTSQVVDDGNELPDNIVNEWNKTPDVGGEVSEAMINWTEIAKWLAIAIGAVGVIYVLSRPKVREYIVRGGEYIGRKARGIFT